MPTYLFAILLFMVPTTVLPVYNDRIRWWLLILIFLSTFFIPLIGMLAFRFGKSIESFEMEERQKRVVPFFFVSLFYGISAYLIYSRLEMGELVNTIMISIFLLVLLCTIITAYWKISIHSAGVAGTFGYLVGINFQYPDTGFLYPVMIWLLITGITMSSRLYLNVHKPSEVYVGALLGFTVSFLSILIFT